MSTPSSIFGEAFLEAIRQAVREKIQAAGNGNKESRLLTAEELAEKLKIPVSWVYEQSRQKKIPTHRLGRYIRFDFHEVIESQKKTDASESTPVGAIKKTGLKEQSLSQPLEKNRWLGSAIPAVSVNPLEAKINPNAALLRPLPAGSVKNQVTTNQSSERQWTLKNELSKFLS